MSGLLIYVAGPYRGQSKEAVELNASVARAVGLLVARKGWAPAVPHYNTYLYDFITTDLDDEFWLNATMELMRRCDAVVLVPGWQRSQGTLAEIKEAQRLGLPIYYAEHDVPEAKVFNQ